MSLFWASTFYDQMKARGNGENTASWMGGGFLFLAIVAFYQLRITRAEPSRRNVILLGIHIVSILGSLICLGVFSYRRWAWTESDSLCVATVGVFVAASFIICLLRKKWASEHAMAPPFSSHLMIVAGVGLRGVPRYFQAATLFVNNALGAATILAGCYIAAVRLKASARTYKETGGADARQAFLLELVGNALSQLVLTTCWIAARLVVA